MGPKQEAEINASAAFCICRITSSYSPKAEPRKHRATLESKRKAPAVSNGARSQAGSRKLQMELQKYRSEHLQNQLKLNHQLTNKFTPNQSVSVSPPPPPRTAFKANQEKERKHVPGKKRKTEGWSSLGRNISGLEERQRNEAVTEKNVRLYRAHYIPHSTICCPIG